MYKVFQQNSNIYAPCIYIQMWGWASDISWSHLKWQYPVNEPKCSFFFFFFFAGVGGGAGLFLSELCFPTCTWSLALSKACFKFSDQTSMNYQYPHVASVRLSSLFPYTAITEISYYRDQRRIDYCLMLYKITYDLVAIPAFDCLTPNHRQSRHIHTLAYRQIPTLKNYDKYTFFPRTIIHWNAPPPVFIPLLPTLAQFSNVVCQVVHLSP